jgi:hypothetical protein
MAVIAKGVDVRQTTGQLLFDALLQDSAGALVTTGTTTAKVYEVQDNGTLRSYDFNDNTFKTTALTTETLALTHRTGNNATTNTGYWSAVLSTLTGFTVGGIYLVLINNTGASPADQIRKFQFGGAQGDFATPDGSGNTKSTILTIATDAVDANALAANAVAEIVAGILVTPANKLATDTAGRVQIQSGISKNVAVNNFTFLMTDRYNNPKPGLTVTATRSLDGVAFAACANSVTEISNGFYKINLAASDLNGNLVALRFTAPGAVDRDITIVTTP